CARGGFYYYGSPFDYW
nr:immunoglobulin heavy chain junction region [Mus musculus]MBK4197089.1 immunoglobulin heavy chain junction region [Mus musculus]